MIEFSNIKRVQGLDFDKYLLMDGISHSMAKSHKHGIFQDIKITDKITVGKLADEIITLDRHHKEHELYLPAKDIAERMKSDFGQNLLSIMKFQVSYFAEMSYDGISLLTKGRPDAEIGTRILIDIKLTENCKDINECHKLADFMGYDNQLWNYSSMGRHTEKYIFMYAKKQKRTFFLKRLITDNQDQRAHDWWANKILELGNFK